MITFIDYGTFVFLSLFSPVNSLQSDGGFVDLISFIHHLIFDYWWFILIWRYRLIIDSHYKIFPLKLKEDLWTLYLDFKSILIWLFILITDFHYELSPFKVKEDLWTLDLEFNRWRRPLVKRWSHDRSFLQFKRGNSVNVSSSLIEFVVSSSLRELLGQFVDTWLRWLTQ